MKEKKPIMPQLKSMSTGEVVTFPLTRMTTVRSTCSMVATESARRFKTWINKERGTINVMRLS